MFRPEYDQNRVLEDECRTHPSSDTRPILRNVDACVGATGRPLLILTLVSGRNYDLCILTVDVHSEMFSDSFRAKSTR